MDTVLYVMREGAVIRRRSESLLVMDAEDKLLMEVESRRLVCVCVLSSVQVTTQALVELLTRKVPVSIFTQSGELLGVLGPVPSGNGALRLAQYEKERDPVFALERAREVVTAKIHNQGQVLREYLYERGRDERVHEVARELDRLATESGAADTMPRLRGLEGAAARQYWSVFGRLLRVDWVRFTGRVARPATDPVNAALSFGYSLLTHRLGSLCGAIGLDPYVGFLHEMAPNRPSLALDLIEPFRAPVVDRFVLSRFNRRIFRPEHFVRLDGGETRFRRESLEIFFREWEVALHRIQAPRHFQAQVEAMRSLFLGNRSKLFPWRWSAR
mgnify:CR=1 FL=1